MSNVTARHACGAPICNDKLLTTNEVATILGTSLSTASAIIRETSHGIKLHKRLYILESNLLAFLKETEARDA